MSRHRDVRSLDYDEILDDASGGNDMTPGEIEKLDQAVDDIAARLGAGFSLDEIKDAAWYYYFDVDQSTNYLLEQKTKKEEKRLKGQTSAKTGTCLRKPDEEISSAPSEPQDPIASPEAVTRPTRGLAMRTNREIDENIKASECSSSNNVQPKKLSKLQQLAKDRAAAKKHSANISDPPASSRSSLATSLAKLKLLKCDNPSQEPATPKASRSSQSPTRSASPKRASGQDEEDSSGERGRSLQLLKSLEAVESAPPSEFACTMLGALSSSGSKDGTYADRDFSCFTVGTEKHLSNIQQSFAKPSPDDIVQKAQSASKGMIKGKISNTANLPAEAELAAAPELKIANKPRTGRSKLMVKKNIALVVVGHVDAGKSTLFGRLLYDTGNIDERSMQKLKRESEKIQKSSFAFAWAMDSNSEERERGVTIDIATSIFETERSSFTILDAPGHKDFVPNMIAGASQADFAIIVIDASRGAFESGFDAAGQTKEHAVLVRSLGIQKVIVAINKMDNVSWSQERFKDIKIQMSTFLRQTGFEESALSFIPCSGLSGENVAKSTKLPSGSWYGGNTLLDEMEVIEATARDETAAFRMIISDIQATPNSSNITIIGRMSSGELQKDDTVVCMPSKEPATVKALLSADSTETSFAGDNVTLTLANIDPMHIRIGDVLCHPSQPVKISTQFKTRMVTFPMLRPLLTGTSIVLHRGRADIPAIIRTIEVPKKSNSGELKTVRHITGSSQAAMTIELIRGVIPLEEFSQNKDLGRVIIRREGETVGAGVVTEVL